MKAEIIAIGTELLLGHIVNSNAAYLSRQLAGLGIDVHYRTTVGDNEKRLLKTIQTTMDRADMVFTIGGLGPTEDDITAQTIAKAIGKKLTLSPNISKEIDRHFKKRGIKTPRINYRQAHIPTGSIALKNTVGTAPGLIIKSGKKTIIALPGPPRELIPMFEQSVASYLKKKHPIKHTIVSRVIKTTGLPESSVCPKVRGFLKMKGKTTVGIYAHLGQVDVKITSKAKNKTLAKKAIKSVEKKIRKTLGEIVFGVDDEALEGVVANSFLKHKKTLAIAESCTGGLTANRITNIPGSSKFFIMGITAYSNQAKTSLLNVAPSLIAKHGAVSKPVAVAMAKGIREISNSTIGIGITGIAGPTGDTKKKPVGTVFIALSTPQKTICKRFQFSGSREDIKFLTSQAVFDMLRLQK